MTWQPYATVDAARARARALECARNFFAERQVLEVETPILTGHATMDPNIESITARMAERRFFLHTSPEYHMKRLLAAGYPDIFQICHVFRASELGQRHLPEFSMVEWYRLGFNLQAIIQESLAFIHSLLGQPIANSESTLLSYQQAFEHTIDLNPLQASLPELIDAIGPDDDLIDAVGDDRDAWLDLALATCVAPTFSKDALTVVHHYPITQASLARECPDNDQLADRFEIYLGELELANGFVELSDAKTQRERFERDQEIRNAKKRPEHNVDTDLLSALQSGLPQCAGVAIGLDRLLMLTMNVDHINSVTTFVPGS